MLCEATPPKHWRSATGKDDRWGRGPFHANLGFAALFGGGTLAEARTRFEEARPLLYGLGSFGTLVVTVLAPLSTIVLKQAICGPRNGTPWRRSSSRAAPPGRPRLSSSMARR